MPHNSTFQQLKIILILLLGIVLLSTLFYHFYEGLNWIKALYMTIITVSTVGFQEVKVLSDTARIFTIILIIVSFGTFAFGISRITQALVSGELKQLLTYRKLNAQIKKLNGHVIICGFGRNGRRAYQKLKAYGQDVLVIERNVDVIRQEVPHDDVLYLEGDATDDEILKQAGIERASALITTLNTDAENLFVVISVRELRRDIRLISRSSNANTEKKLRAAGVDAVVMPEAVGGAHMATLVMSPTVVEFLDRLSVEGSSDINMEEVRLTDVPHYQTGLSLGDLLIRQRTGCTVIGIKDPDKGYVVNPGTDQILSPEASLVVLGKAEQIQSLHQFLQNFSSN